MNSSTPSSPSLTNPSLPESTTTASTTTASIPNLEDSHILDVDQFVKTLQNIKSKNVHPDILASIIAHYTSKWLLELSSPSATCSASAAASPMGSTAAWLKKRFFIENLVNILPPEKDSMPCDFMLRLLRTASMVGAGPGYMTDLEARVAFQLDKASLKEVMIPAFSHTCGTLLDVGMVTRLVKKFLELEEVSRSGAAMVKVAKLVDLYLAEVALDTGLKVEEFKELAMAMPSHARAMDDGLYRAVDTFIKAHPNTTKQEKKALSRLIDPRKLTPEASLHAIHNDRLPVRLVIEVLFSEQSKLNRITEGSSPSFSATRSLSPALEAPGRCPSTREVLAQQHEMRKLRDDVTRLQTQCQALQAQIDRLSSENKKKGVFKWGNFLFRTGDLTERPVDDYEVGIERITPRTPMEGRKGRMVHGKGTPKWRNSLS